MSGATLVGRAVLCPPLVQTRISRRARSDAPYQMRGHAGTSGALPDVDAKLKTPNTADEKFEDVVKSAQDAAVLVLVY